GKIIYSNGDIYEGEFKNNLIHGRGIFKWDNGDIYEGDFKRGKKDGKGEFLWINGDSYRGDFKDDKREGIGVFKSRLNNIEYSGEFKDNKFHGKGKFKQNDSFYYGSFANGVRHGYGYSFDLKNDIVYKEKYENGRLLS